MSISYYTSLLSEVRLIRYKYHSFDGLQIRKVFYLNYINPRQQIIYRAIPASQNANVVLVKRDFFLNNQPDALIIPILFCYKNLHVVGISFAHHHEFSTVHSALVSFMQILITASKQRQILMTASKQSPSSLCLEAVIKICMKLISAECTVENS